MKLFFLIVILACSARVSAQSNQHYIDSLRHKLATSKEDTNKVFVLAALGSVYAQTLADTSILYAEMALELAERLQYEPGLLAAEGSLAVALITVGNYPLGLEHSFKTLSLAKKIDSSAIPWANSLVAWCYHYLGEDNTSLKYTREGFKLAQPWEVPFGWRDLALSFNSLRMIDSALLYATKSYERLKGSPMEGNIANILGGAYAGKGEFDSALLFYQIGVVSSKKENLPVDLVDSYNAIAAVYNNKNEVDSAVWYSQQVLKKKTEKGYPIGMLKAVNLLAEIYQKRMPDSALKYLLMTLKLKDSLFSREKTMAIQNLAYKEQEKQKEIQTAKLQANERIRLYSLVGGLFTVMVVAGLLYRNNRQKQKANVDIQNAYSSLKATQAQMLQQEKMASLGELTAGIAHEIQNPLNFVNNFSEVNSELLLEMKEELSRGNYTEVNSLAGDIHDNERKINEHGKRAESIVKGMLLHSRTSSGVTELTDINKQADEFLRLAYHGFRAKDKAFNAVIETDYGQTVGSINVVPQEIGRVFLNLFNNAFYAVNEKKTKQQDEYEPTVSVVTKRTIDKVIITVKDNGDGIPQKISDKIFQPFFTTKPTGQGTGLGLSLAYDIVKAHGGEIRVETKVGEGSQFILQIPLK